MAYFIEKPADEFGNRGFPYAVIEGEIDGEDVRITSPPEIAEKWPVWRLRHFVQVFEGAGPARVLKGSAIDLIPEMDAMIKEFKIEE